MAQVGAKVTRNAQEAARLVASGTPVVLMPGAPSTHLPDPPDLPAGDPPGLVALMTGPPGPELDAAAAEMAGELFVWAVRAGRSEQDRPGV
jgi:hypothetical protein